MLLWHWSALASTWACASRTVCSCGKGSVNYRDIGKICYTACLMDFREDLAGADKRVSAHALRVQCHCVTRHNLRARENTFEVRLMLF